MHISTCLNLLLIVATLSVVTQYAILAHGSSQHALAGLQSLISRHGHLALVTCKGRWEDEDLFWLRHLQFPVTLWNLPKREFLNLVIGNHQVGIKTSVLVAKLGSNVSGCLTATFRYQRFTYFVAWILIDNSKEAKNTLRQYVSETPVRNFTCQPVRNGVSEGFKKETSDASFGGVPTVYYRGCSWGGEGNGVERAKSSELRNKVISVGCIHTTSFAGAATACHNHLSTLIWNALSFYNVTLEWAYYRNTNAFFTDVFDGFIDIYGNLGSLTTNGLRDTATPAIILHTRETFYAAIGEPVLVSFFDIISKSMVGCFLLALSYSAYLLALAIADYGELTLSGFLDSFAALLASFFGTSTSIPNRRRRVIARTVLYGFWMVGILPLSNYLRGELISRLSMRARPEAIDTLSELEDALDRQMVAPCVVVGTSMHFALETDRDSRSFIHQKLRWAFQRSSEREMLVSRSWQECLSCAERRDRVCLGVEVSKHALKPRVVKSTENLRPVFATTAMRKNFPYARAYSNILRRVFEGSLSRGQWYLYHNLDHVKGEEDAARHTSEQMAEHMRFFVVFTGFLVSSTVVLFLELLIGCLIYDSDGIF